MADGGEDADGKAVTFDLFNDIGLVNDLNITDKLSQEEKDEVMDIVNNINPEEFAQEIEQAQPVKSNRHLGIQDTELDRLAAKNNALETHYQTTWAKTVFLGIY